MDRPQSRLYTDKRSIVNSILTSLKFSLLRQTDEGAGESQAFWQRNSGLMKGLFAGDYVG